MNLTSFRANFMGHSPRWYKNAIILFLVINPILMYTIGPFVTGWVLLLQFIFTLAMALRCYPLQPGGLLALEAVAIGMTTPERVYEETLLNFPVILLLIFMVAGIYFMKEFLLYIFTNLIVKVKSKVALSLLFSFSAAFLSAFLDALTVTAVIIAVAIGFYSVYHKFASAHPVGGGEHDHTDDAKIGEQHHNDLSEFRAFLRNIMMHGAVGTALGGVMTLVGEPQNLLIANIMHWHFIEFFVRMTPVTIPVLIVGLLTCAALEHFRIFGYGVQLPINVRTVLEQYAEKQKKKKNKRDWAKIVVQGVVGIYLMVALAFHLAEVGIIGLSVIILLTAFTGVTEEHQIGKAFEEALPFTALLVVFFAVVAVIHEQHLFAPVIDWTLSLEGNAQLLAFFSASGILSMISDNVFVATVYISEAQQAFEAGRISQQQFDHIAVAINTGTNIPSVATPNGQAAFLFLLTSAAAQLIRLSYVRMIMLALPYTVTMSITAFICVAVAL